MMHKSLQKLRPTSRAFLKHAWHLCIYAFTGVLFAGWGHAEVIDFEEDSGYKLGSDVSTVSSWAKTPVGGARVSSDESHSGSQSLDVPSSKTGGGAVKIFTIPKEGIVFADFYIKPTADPQVSPLSTVDANGAILGFVKNEGQGSVVAVTDSVTGASIATGVIFDIDDRNLATDWLHVTIRQDIKAKTWDLFVDGKLALIDQPLINKSKSGALIFYPDPAGPSFVDDLLISETNPLFLDENQDDVPDAFEKALGFDPSAKGNRNLSIRGKSLMQLFCQISSSTNLATTSALVGRKLIYVDNQNGSDQGTGEFSYPVNGRGAKATLWAAIRQADADTTIVLLPSNKPYQLKEKSKGVANTINLLPIGDVTLGGAEN